MISKKTIEAKFRRAGLSPRNTCLWDDMQDDLKLQVQDKVRLQPDDPFVICFHKPPNYLLLLTVNRIIIVQNEHIVDFLYASIDEVKLNKVFSGEQSKEDNDTINIVLNSGQIVDIKVEKGTWHILYSIIKLCSA